MKGKEVKEWDKQSLGGSMLVTLTKYLAYAEAPDSPAKFGLQIGLP